MKSFIFLLIFAASFTSCKSTISKEIKSKSPNSITEIKVIGSKSSFLDPWQVDITAINGKKSKNFQFELFASSLDSSTVKLHWEDENNCIALFKQSDGDVSFKIYITESEVSISEIK